MSLWRPDEVTSALSTYIETLSALDSYAPWANARWRRAMQPLFLQREAAASAPLAFSLKDDPVTIESVDPEAVRYRAQLEISYLFPLQPASSDQDWRRALLAGHHLISHLLRPTSDFPLGIDIVENRGNGIRRGLSVSGWMLCDITLAALYDSPLIWS